jgi:putative hydrolase of the HAD superfamily
MSAPSIRAVLFDLGGTLVDERNFVGWSEVAHRCLLDAEPDRLAHAYRQVETEVDAHPRPDLWGEAGLLDFWQKVLSEAVGREIGRATVERFAAGVRDLDGEIHLFSDARRCLEALRAERRALGVVSNSSSEARVRTILDRAGILDYFSRVVSSGTEGVAKPHPEIFRRAVHRMEVDPQQALYVGNLASTDARAAAAAGLHSVWLHRDGTGLGDDPPEITSLLEVPLVVRRIESGS